MVRKRRKLKPWIKHLVIIFCSLILFLSGYLLGLKSQSKNIIIFEPKLKNHIATNLDFHQINRSNIDFNKISADNINTITSKSLSEGHQNDSDNNLVYLGEFLITGYCDCPICQEEWVGTTALGVAPTTEWTIAVDPDVIPLGSYIWIEGHRYRAEDVGGAINCNHIDIFMPSHEECYNEICNGYKDVYIESNE